MMNKPSVNINNYDAHKRIGSCNRFYIGKPIKISKYNTINVSKIRFKNFLF